MDNTIQPSTAAAVLLVSHFEEDHVRMGQVLAGMNLRLWRARSYMDALRLLRQNVISIVVCEHELPDGDWKDVLGSVGWLAQRPSLIVTSRLADERLWVEVLNLGGDDVLVQPLNERDVRWAIESARRGGQQWMAEAEPVRQASA